MIRLLTWAFFFLLACEGFAHSPLIAEFEIRRDGDQHSVVADLPWTIRQAVESFNPSLNQTPTAESLQDGLRHYISTNFWMISENGDSIFPQGITEIQGDHDHSYVVQWIMPCSEWKYLNNSLLCELSEKHRNINRFKVNELVVQLNTTSNKPRIEAAELEEDQSLPTGWWSVLAVTSAALLAGFWLIRRSKFFRGEKSGS